MVTLRLQQIRVPPGQRILLEAISWHEFEAIVEDYKLNDPALRRLAFTVRGADVKGQEHIAAEGLGGVHCPSMPGAERSLRLRLSRQASCVPRRLRALGRGDAC